MEVIVLIALSLAFIATWAVVVVQSGSRWRDGLPPGPPTLPILGNLLQLRRNPHRSLAKLANTYGPLMSLKLGSRTAVVVSSPEMVTEVMQRNGLASSNRFRTAAMAVHGHDEVSMGTLPATSDGWKKLRRIGKEKLFSNQALEQSQSLRRERLSKLADHVSSCCGGGRAMNVGEATFVTMFNVMVATFFSDVDFAGSFSGSAATKEFQAHVNGFINNIGIPNISDFIPILAPLDPQGIRRKVGFHYGSMLAIVRSIIEQRLKQRAASSTPYRKKNDFLETLLDLMEGNECELSINEIEHFCLVSFI